ncbi:MAG: ABC transporter permease [Chloroflexota bacterium]
MRVVWIVFAKEFLDIVRNRRRFIWMLVSSFVIFPILFIAPYALILGRVTEQTTDTLTLPVQGMEYAPDLMEYLKTEKDIQPISATNAEELVLNRKYAVGLVVPEDYEQRVAAGQTVQLTVVTDGRKSMDFRGTRLYLALSDYTDVLLAERIVERGLPDEFLQPLEVEEQNAATAAETRGSQLGLLIPGLIISMGLGAGLPVAVASIAGEKKNLTLEPVLFTTVNRFHLVLAKLYAVLASILFNLLSMILMFFISASALAFVLIRASDADVNSLLENINELSSSPGATDPAASGVPALTETASDGSAFQPLAIALFLLTPILIILFGALLEIIISAWARNDEEAYTYLAPLNFLGLVVLLSAFFLDEFTPQLWHYALPFFGAIFSMRDLLSNRIDPASLAVMFVSSIVYVAFALWLAVWMFHREEIVFRT